VQVEAAVRLLEEGATVPFVARYRKEVTGGLADTDLRTREKRLAYLRELAQRRDVVLKSLAVRHPQLCLTRVTGWERTLERRRASRQARSLL
jgi:transcriptional accessory protein Tex/SPT6